MASDFWKRVLGKIVETSIEAYVETRPEKAGKAAVLLSARSDGDAAIDELVAAVKSKNWAATGAAVDKLTATWRDVRTVL